MSCDRRSAAAVAPPLAARFTICFFLELDRMQFRTLLLPCSPILVLILQALLDNRLAPRGLDLDDRPADSTPQRGANILDCGKATRQLLDLCAAKEDRP